MQNEQPKPEVGMGATQGVGSDAYPYTIIEVSPNGKTIKVQSDKHTPAEGYDYYSNQVYNYHQNPNGEIITYTLRKNGRYHAQGEPIRGGRALVVGRRCYKHDPHF